MGALSTRYVLENGDAAPFLVKNYFAIDLGILTVGFICWLRCLFAWRVAFHRVNTALQCYFWVFLSDAMTLVNFFVMSSFGVALGRLPEGWACTVCAFVSMTLAYVYANAYLIASFVALFMVLGLNEKSERSRRLAWLAGGAGLLWGFGISVAYASAGMFGPYRHLYCMIPRSRYNQWGLILGFVFVGVQVIGAMSVTAFAAYYSHSTRETPLLVGAQAVKLGPVEKTARIRAFEAIQRTNIIMLIIYFISQGIVLAVEIQIWLDGPIPVLVDALSGMLYKSQVIWDSLVIHRLLYGKVQRDAQVLGQAQRQVLRAKRWASKATVAPAPERGPSGAPHLKHTSTIGTSEQGSNHIMVSGTSSSDAHSESYLPRKLQSGFHSNSTVGATPEQAAAWTYTMVALKAIFPAAFVPLWRPISQPPSLGAMITQDTVTGSIRGHRGPFGQRRLLSREDRRAVSSGTVPAAKK